MNMEWYKLVAIAALFVCIMFFAVQFIKLIRLGVPKDLSKKDGDIESAVVYSFTKAMSPSQKESAYMHLPTYAAGIIYHMGTFAALLLFVLLVIFSFFDISVPPVISSVVSGAFLFTSLSGIGILFKRILNSELRSLSGFDDYISNILTSGVQLVSALYLLFPSVEIFYFLSFILLFIWLPIGKTKHLMYFFFARFHLGFFYGWRGTWPQKPH